MMRASSPPNKVITKTWRLGDNSISILLSGTQLRKSTISANKIVRTFFKEGSLFDYNQISPGQKVILPCRILSEYNSTETEGSFLIPARRGDTQPEPRFWIYRLNQFAREGDTLQLSISDGVLIAEINSINLS